MTLAPGGTGAADDPDFGILATCPSSAPWTATVWSAWKWTPSTSSSIAPCAPPENELADRVFKTP
jgi:hypothetical protein